MKSLRELSAIYVISILYKPVQIGMITTEIKEYSTPIVFLPIPQCLKLYLLKIYIRIEFRITIKNVRCLKLSKAIRITRKQVSYKKWRITEISLVSIEPEIQDWIKRHYNGYNGYNMNVS